ncbi:MAG: hypothetical protein KDD11_21705 [Acidobacteria bacterium]|nr:hypothetical protein [Acidobacteriota bacterium]
MNACPGLYDHPWHLTVPALLLAALLGCAAPRPALSDDTLPPCAERTEKQCIDSPDCTLAPTGDENTGYICRDTANECEAGFRQSDGTPAECQAKPGCRFSPGRCYCPPDVQCVCGGGPPPSCVPSEPALPVEGDTGAADGGTGTAGAS